MSNTSNVTAGKPKIGGAIYRAPLGTTLPTDATTALDEEKWLGIGYCSDDGLTNSNTRSSNAIKAWGGDEVLNIQSEKVDNFQTTWIETLNVNTLKAVHGDDNVSGTLTEGITVKVNSKELDAAAYVIDMLLRDNAIKRVVIPNGKITEVGDVVYSDDDVVGYPVTISCMPDDSSNTHYEYIIRKSSTPEEPIASPSVSAASQSDTMFGTSVADMQSGITIANGAITGTLHYLGSGELVDRWGAGNFIALQFADIDAEATSVKVGLNPSQGSGLVEIIDDPDKNGAFKVTDKDNQVFRVVITNGTDTVTKDYDLSGLVVETA